jgi:hypothetical protein
MSTTQRNTRNAAPVVQAPVATELTTMSVREFMNQEGFVSLVTVIRKNSNGYPYITFIDADNNAENIYFSKAASEKVSAGDTVTGALLKPMVVALTVNADGEERWKISSGNSLRASADDLGL